MSNPRIRRALRAGLVLATLVAPGFAATQAAEASTVRGCRNDNAVCLYDGKGYRGAVKGVSCNALKGSSAHNAIPLPGFARRASSLINGCKFTVSAQLVYPNRRATFARYYAKKWYPDLGGARRADNAIQLLFR